MENQPTTISPYAVTPELHAARTAVEAARGKSKKLADLVNTTAAQATTLEADAQRLQTELAAEEGALAMAEGAAVKRHEKSVERLSGELEGKEKELKRARAKIAALEGMAPGIDDEVTAAGTALSIELGMWGQSVTAALSAELGEAVKPLVGVMAKARAIGAPLFLDFLQAAYVPDPIGFMRIMTRSDGWDNRGRNLLDGIGESQWTAEADAISAQLSPVKLAMSAARIHREYVPLARRQGPYVRKGYEVRGSDFWAKKREAAAPMEKPQPPARKPEPQELSMGPALVENIDGPRPQQQQ